MVGVGRAALQQRVLTSCGSPKPKHHDCGIPRVRGADGSDLALEIGEIFKYLDVTSSLGFWRMNGTHLSCI